MHQAFLGWGQGQSYGSPFRGLLTMFGPVPMLHLGTAAGPSRREAITPAAIAAGGGDSYLFALNAAIGEFGKLVILLHGGPKAQVNARLKAQGLPPIGQDLVVNPYPSRLRVIWNPLAGVEHGSNPASRYYPGDGCTDMIGNDMYSSSPGGGSFEENQALYDVHPRKPYSLPEWGLQDVDDPSFVQRICDFVKTHRRTQMAAYYESKPGSIYDLGDKPKSKVVYRRCLTPIGAPAPA